MNTRMLLIIALALAAVPVAASSDPVCSGSCTVNATVIPGYSPAVLAVPSAVIPAETNYLLNPLHPDFRRIKIGTARRFETDLRLIKRSR